MSAHNHPPSRTPPSRAEQAACPGCVSGNLHRQAADSDTNHGHSDDPAVEAVIDALASSGVEWHGDHRCIGCGMTLRARLREFGYDALAASPVAESGASEEVFPCAVLVDGSLGSGVLIPGVTYRVAEVREHWEPTGVKGEPDVVTTVIMFHPARAEPGASEERTLSTAEWARLRSVDDIVRELVNGWDHGFPSENEHSATDIIDRLRPFLTEPQEPASPTSDTRPGLDVERLAHAAAFMLNLIDFVYGTDNPPDGPDALPDEAEFHRHAAVIHDWIERPRAALAASPSSEGEKP